MAYVSIGIAGILYALMDARDPGTFLSVLGDAGRALFLFALVTELTVWTMVMAFGKLSEARNKGREEGRAEGRAEGQAEEYVAMIQALREAGISEPDIRRVQAQRAARG